jgi:hypothetical protein
MPTTEIQIPEHFDDALGRLTNYDAGDPTTTAVLESRQHIDIATFPTPKDRSLTMLDFDTYLMDFLDLETMADLELSIPVVDEDWRFVTFSADASNGYRNRILLHVNANSAGSTEGTVGPVDLTPMSNGYVCLALPGLGSSFANINQSLSYVELRSGDNGFYNIHQVTFANGTFANDGSGNYELRIPVSSYVGFTLDVSAITQVIINVRATSGGAVDFYVNAIRVLPASYDFAPLQVDTLYNRIQKTVNRYGICTSTTGYTLTTWPTLLRADDPPGVADPQPIDAEYVVPFCPGKNHGTNTISLYFRHLALDQNTQLDLTDTFTQEDLNNYGTELETVGSVDIWTVDTLPNRRVQPDFGRALFTNRVQSDLDTGQTMGSLDGDTQYALERLHDDTSLAYVKVSLTFGDSAPTLSLQDESGNGVSYTLSAFTDDLEHVWRVRVEDNSVSSTVYTSDAQGYIYNTVFETSVITSEAWYPRRKGRTGYNISFTDASCWVGPIKTAYTNFAQYVSLPYRSETPVIGAQLTAHASADRQLVTSLAPTIRWGGVLSLDNTKSTSGFAYKVSASPPPASDVSPYYYGFVYQGAETNAMYLDDLDNTQIDFDIWFPSTLTNAGGTLTAMLIGGPWSAPPQSTQFPGTGYNAFTYPDSRRVIPLDLHQPTPDTWEHVTIDLTPLKDEIQPDNYSFVLVQTTAVGLGAWYLDNVRCKTRVVGWEGRGDPDDAWGMDEGNWLPFKDTVNGVYDGLVFAERGRGMQIRATALRQDAFISDVKVQPRYAELGRFVWGRET